MSLSGTLRDLRHNSVFSTVLALVVVASLAGCSSDDKKNPVAPGGSTPTSTTFTGVFTGPTTGGKVVITVATTSLAPGLHAARAGAAAVTATGTLTPNGGSAVALTGTYDPATDLVDVSGGGYTVNAFYDAEFTPPGMTGTFTGPSEDGNVLCPVGDGTAVKTFCGSYTADVGSGGEWNFIISGTSAAGYAWEDGATEMIPLFGTVTGTGETRDITLGFGSPDVTLTATGTWNTTTNAVSGVWNSADALANPLDSGTWSGALCP